MLEIHQKVPSLILKRSTLGPAENQAQVRWVGGWGDVISWKLPSNADWVVDVQEGIRIKSSHIFFTDSPSKVPHPEGGVYPPTPYHTQGNIIIMFL